MPLIQWGQNMRRPVSIFMACIVGVTSSNSWTMAKIDIFNHLISLEIYPQIKLYNFQTFFQHCILESNQSAIVKNGASASVFRRHWWENFFRCYTWCLYSFFLMMLLPTNQINKNNYKIRLLSSGVGRTALWREREKSQGFFLCLRLFIITRLAANGNQKEHLLQTYLVVLCLNEKEDQLT